MMMKANKKKLLQLKDIPSKGKFFNHHMDDDERQDACNYLNLIAVDDFHFSGNVQPLRGGKLYRMMVDIHMTIQQICVVSSHPFTSTLNGDNNWDFTIQPPPNTTTHISHLQDMPEYLENGLLDIHEYVLQSASLMLDPFPRCPESETDAIRPFDNLLSDKDVDERVKNAIKKGKILFNQPVHSDEEQHPFAKLKALKDKIKNN